MDLGLKDRTYLITGGSTGVGLALVHQLLEEGANVVTCARRSDVLEEAVEKLSGLPGTVKATVCDVRDREQVDALVHFAEDSFGGLDGLVNNAGEARMKGWDDLGEDDWFDELHLKFGSVLNLVGATLPLLRQSSVASIVNVNAVLAKQPEPRLIATSAARAGILNLSTSLAQEFAQYGIRVNSVCLGLIDTGQWTRRYEMSSKEQDYESWQQAVTEDRDIPMKRFGTANEVAFAIAMLLSPLASYITGTSIDVCGGSNRSAW